MKLIPFKRVVSRLYDSFLHNNIEIQSVLSKVEESALNNLLNLNIVTYNFNTNRVFR